MELRQLKARLALLDTMLDKMNASPVRIQHIKRTVFVLRSLLNDGNGIPSVYREGPSMGCFSLQ